MAEIYTRVVIKPAGLGDGDAARLLEILREAVRRQRQLSDRSPHVLQFVGELREDDQALVIEHEPACALQQEHLYDPTVAPDDEDSLLRTASALADALGVAHSQEGAKRRAHGAVCTGVILETPDGIRKVTDFGFAHAICAVLGVHSYLELAVGPGGETSHYPGATGIWQVLSPDVATRDDRICGFVDPEKYGSRALDTFEPRSDIMAAGILLHLLAEHRHPLLGGPEDHRMVALAESMAFLPYNGARRKDLRESPNPAVRRWCELVAAMLSRLPQDRPSALNVARALEEMGVKPAGQANLLAGQLRIAAAAAEAGAWGRVRDTAAQVAANSDATPQAVEQARTLLERADAAILLEDAQERLSSSEWASAEDLLNRLSTMPLSPQMAEAVQELAGTCRTNLDAKEHLQRVEDTLPRLTASEATSAVSAIDDLIQILESLPDDKSLVPPLRRHRKQLRETLLGKREELQEREKAIAAEHELVEGWFAELKSAWHNEQWVDVESLLRSRPMNVHWPKTVKIQTERFEGRLEEVRAVRTWMQNMEASLEADDLEAVDKLTADSPQPAGWPRGLTQQLDDILTRAHTANSMSVDRLRAHEWIEGVERAITEQNWERAGRELDAKPQLEFFPPQVLGRAKRCRTELDARLDDNQRRRASIEKWLHRADQAAEGRAWKQALDVISAPPVGAGQLPEDIEAEVDRRRRSYLQELRIGRTHEIEQINGAVRDLVTGLVDDLVALHLQSLADPGIVNSSIAPIEWDTDDTRRNGRSKLTVVVSGLAGQEDNGGVSSAFQVAVENDGPRIVDAETIQATLGRRLRELLTTTQERQAAELAMPLRKGLFPHAEVKLEALRSQTIASIFLFGASSADTKITAELVWDTTRLSWNYVDEPSLARDLVDTAVAKTRDLVKPMLLESSELLRRYASILSVDVAAPSLQSLPAVPSSLTLTCRAVICPPGGEESQPILSVPVTVPQVGKVIIDADFGTIEKTIEQVVATRQNLARVSIERQLVEMAPCKVNLAVKPKRIRKPVELVQFNLAAKSIGTVELAAIWNANAFNLELPSDAQTQIERALRPPTPDPAPEPTSSPLPRSAPLRTACLAVLAGAVMVVAIWAVWPPPPPPGPRGGEFVNEQADLAQQFNRISGAFGGLDHTKFAELIKDIDEFNKNRNALKTKTSELEPEIAAKLIDVLSGYDAANEYRASLTTYETRLNAAEGQLSTAAKEQGASATIADLQNAITQADGNLNKAQEAWGTPRVNHMRAALEKVITELEAARTAHTVHERGTHLANAAVEAENAHDLAPVLSTLVVRVQRAESEAAESKFHGALTQAERGFGEAEHARLQELSDEIGRLLDSAVDLDRKSGDEDLASLKKMNAKLKAYKDSQMRAEKLLSSSGKSSTLPKLRENIDGAIKAGEEASSNWRTGHIQRLIAGLRPVASTLKKAEAAVNWRDAIGQLDAAAKAAKTIGDLAPALPATIDRFRRSHVGSVMDNLQERFRDLEGRFHKPNHSDAGILLSDIGGFVDDAEWLMRNASEKDQSLMQSVQTARGQTQDLERYQRHMKLPDAEAIRRGIGSVVEGLNTAKKAWTTTHVTVLLAELDSIHQPLEFARNRADSKDWPGVVYFLGAARDALSPDGSGKLGELANVLVDKTRAELVGERRQSLAANFNKAAAWLKDIGDPPPGLQQSEYAEEARGYLDLLGAEFDKNLELMDEANVFDENDRKIVADLLLWTVRSLKIPGTDVSIDFVVIPNAKDKGLSNPFWVSQTEVTVGQYRAVMGSAPVDNEDEVDSATERADDHPVGYVTLKNTQSFITKLNNVFEENGTFRLPSKAEWEHAFFAGRVDTLSAHPGFRRYDPENGMPTTDLTGANFLSMEHAGSEHYMATLGEDGYAELAPTRAYRPNAWLLYQMLGNVREWVVPDRKNILLGGSFIDPYEPNGPTEFSSGSDDSKDVNGFRFMAQEK